ncbi:hypothetical protein CBR_g11219 [Chara braunii]|uniref:3-hydroxyisobutyryl-CoA hydrolase n=1 Tax=Chara braunii TaxID=69332 RepID=A0A388KQE0_CHABU|nr:hypothetical protein CBR_g11219 [Chara braunii]|eukprot:GBG72291.1 hypothetical protein CBR_g11219 [Chara braunii]
MQALRQLCQAAGNASRSSSMPSPSSRSHVAACRVAQVAQVAQAARARARGHVHSGASSSRLGFYYSRRCSLGGDPPDACKHWHHDHPDAEAGCVHGVGARLRGEGAGGGGGGGGGGVLVPVRGISQVGLQQQQQPQRGQFQYPERNLRSNVGLSENKTGGSSRSYSSSSSLASSVSPSPSGAQSRTAAAAVRSALSGAADDNVLVEEDMSLRTAVLSRPRVLNSLSLDMIRRLHKLWSVWEVKPHVKIIAIRGEGRAFCAGGDVRAVYDIGLKNRRGGGGGGGGGRDDVAAAAASAMAYRRYFEEEYKMNYHLSTLKKPHVAILNGIVMGGGAGVSMHGHFRVVTENVVFAMPEVGIGLHPDVGASYFLSRLPGQIGTYLGLTGARINWADMVATGLATHYVPSHRLELLRERLSGLYSSSLDIVEIAISEASDKVHVSEAPIVRRKRIIDECFSKDSVEEVMAALEAHASAASASAAAAAAAGGGGGGIYPGAAPAPPPPPPAAAAGAGASTSSSSSLPQSSSDAEWCRRALQAMEKASPTSLKITLRSIREAATCRLHECLRKEYRLTVRCVKEGGDFYEGVRAVLVDKDNSPKWKPPTLAEVTEEMVDRYFAPFPSPSDELELPVEEREGRRGQQAAAAHFDDDERRREKVRGKMAARSSRDHDGTGSRQQRLSSRL